jgi:hypothetical protein
MCVCQGWNNVLRSGRGYRSSRNVCYDGRREKANLVNGHEGDECGGDGVEVAHTIPTLEVTCQDRTIIDGRG